MAFSSRNPLSATTRENVDIDPPKAVQELQTELTMSNKEWAQSFKEQQDQIKELKKKQNQDHQIMYGDMDYIIRSLLNEMVGNIETEVNCQKRRNVIDYDGNQGQKKPRIQ